MNQIKELLLQLFIMLMPYVAFNAFYRDKQKSYSRGFIIIISMVYLFLSMLFSYVLVEGVFVDSRYVIMFFGLVFGGIQTGLFLFAEFVILRVFLEGGSGQLAAIVIMLITFLMSILLSRVYRRTKFKNLTTVATGILCGLVPASVLFLFHPELISRNIFLYILLYLCMSAVGIWLLISLFAKAASDKELSIRYAQTEKVETISQVAASLVHEVRNPLTTVKGFLKLIYEAPLSREKIMNYIEISMEEIIRTEAILTDYLSLSKPLSENQGMTDLSIHLNSIYEVLIPFANMNNVALEVQSHTRGIWIRANGDKVKQVLLNFIKNAIEACSMNPDGLVSIRLTVQNTEAVLIITDNGVGMGKGALERLGSIYYSTKTNGTGLGLTFSYKVIRGLGGTIKVNSDPGKGTSFIITIPVHAQISG
jgi:two-component system sporulation sensor kinase B